MPSFSKLYQFIDRLFPHMGEGIVRPHDVTDSVQLVHELYKADMKHLFFLTSQDTSQAGAGANIPLTTIPEPQVGFVNIPLVSSVFVTGGAGTTRTQVQALATGNPADIPVLFTDLTSVCTLDLNPDHWVPVPVRFPCPRGFIMQILFEAVPAGRTVRTRGMAVQLPLEVIDWQLMMTLGGFGFTQAV